MANIKLGGTTAISESGGTVTYNGTIGTSATGFGLITNAQQFRLNNDEVGSGSIGTTLADWVECTHDYQRVGSIGWSQSSGIFSTTLTGVYLCFWAVVIHGTSAGDRMDPSVQIAADGSNYYPRSLGWGMVEASSPLDTTIGNTFIFDVSNISTFRLKMIQSTTNNIATATTISGSDSAAYTNILFVRIGNT